MDEKTGFPDESELVLCTVTSVQHHSVFVRIEEYGINGMIHISEVAPGRIRNIRDYVVESKSIVCKVLRVDNVRGHIDLSLRRVSESQRRKKINELKKEKLAEKIVEVAARNINMDSKELYKVVSTPIFELFPNLFDCFTEIVKGDFLISELNLPKNASDELESVILDRLKPQIIISKGKLSLVSYAPNGVLVIKASLKKSIDLGAAVAYLGGGTYSLAVEDDTYKAAEASLEKASEAAINYIESQGGEGEFSKSK